MINIHKTTNRRQRAIRSKGKPYQAAIELFCKANNLPLPQTEYKFHKTRNWRFDFYWQGQGTSFERDDIPPLAVEIEGGVWVKGGHVRGKHFESDCQKYAEAAIAGITVIRMTPGQLNKGLGLSWIERYLKGEG